MSAEPVHWSEKKQKRLQEHLVGGWAEDTWELRGPKEGKCYWRFSLTSPSLKTELKYAIWYKFDSGGWNVKTDQHVSAFFFRDIVAWLNQVAPTLPSLLEQPLEYWEWSLRSYLLE